jgi:hypothetical protein
MEIISSILTSSFATVSSLVVGGVIGIRWESAVSVMVIVIRQLINDKQE